jgi:hypothetical protein
MEALFTRFSDRFAKIGCLFWKRAAAVASSCPRKAADPGEKN